MIFVITNNPYRIEAFLYQGEPEYLDYLEETCMAQVEPAENGVTIYNPDPLLPLVFLKEGNWLIIEYSSVGDIIFSTKTPKEFEDTYKPKTQTESHA